MGVTWTVVSRSDCHLCEKMIAVLDDHGSRLGIDYSVVDVDQEPALLERFSDVVPVLLRDGVPVAKVRLESSTLQRLVNRSRR